MRRKTTAVVALCGIVAAMEFVMLYLGSVSQILDLSLCALASFITALVVIEAGGAAPWAVYAVTGIVSVLLLPDKFIAVVYLLFTGYYPMVKAAFERRHYVVSWVLKLSLFNTALIAVILISRYILLLEEELIGFEILLIVLANVTFVLYDICFTKLVTLYLVKIRKRLKLKNYFEN